MIDCGQIHDIRVETLSFRFMSFIDMSALGQKRTLISGINSNENGG
jgi:hypothetical protein